MITIKNSKDDNINEGFENLKKIIEEIQQKIIDITGIPKNRLN